MPKLWTVIAVLIALWLVATVLKFTIGGLINILLVIAVGLAIYHLVVKNRR